MNVLIGGSVALKHWLKDESISPKDTDYFCYRVDCPFDLTKFEESICNFLYTDKTNKREVFIVDNCPPLQWILKNNINSTYMDLSNLLVLKNAHKHFYLGKYKKSFKHLIDYSRLLKCIFLSSKQKSISKEYNQWLIEWAYFNDSRLLHFPKLDKSKTEFFNPSVKYFVEHDLIHEKVAIEDKPAYTKCLTGEVMFSNKLFNQLDYQSKVNMVLEESFVLALERCLIPMFKGETYLPAITPEEAFKYSLTRVSTNISSGAFRSFAADNFDIIFQQYLNKHINYYKIIQRIL